MAYRVFSGCLGPEALSEERQAQFPTTALPNHMTPPCESELTRACNTTGRKLGRECFCTWVFISCISEIAGYFFRVYFSIHFTARLTTALGILPVPPHLVIESTPGSIVGY